jgi:hypothetical protein
MKTDTVLSRRKLLAHSLPAIAAVSVPAAASGLAGLPMGDAVLLALGEKLKPLAAELNAARAIDRQRLENFDAKLAALGLKPEEEYENQDAHFHERWRLIEEHDPRMREDNEVELDFDRMHDGVFALLDEILAIRPTTLEGFAVQVFAIVTCHDGLCYESEENAPVPYGVIEFFCRTCEFVGIPIPAA